MPRKLCRPPSKGWTPASTDSQGEIGLLGAASPPWGAVGVGHAARWHAASAVLEDGGRARGRRRASVWETFHF
jgi:hypothetical protein